MRFCPQSRCFVISKPSEGRQVAAMTLYHAPNSATSSRRFATPHFS